MTPWRDREAWLPIDAPVLTCGTACRGASHYLDVVAQFEVTTASRYQPRGGYTFCNIYVWDVTRAMSAEIPHWWLGRELNANATQDWLAVHGRGLGWFECQEPEVLVRVNEGLPAVASWKNPGGGPGHIAMVVPSTELDGRPYISQAGGKCLHRRPLAEGFGALPVRYFAHA